MSNHVAPQSVSDIEDVLERLHMTNRLTIDSPSATSRIRIFLMATYCFSSSRAPFDVLLVPTDTTFSSFFSSLPLPGVVDDIILPLAYRTARALLEAELPLLFDVDGAVAFVSSRGRFLGVSESRDVYAKLSVSNLVTWTGTGIGRKDWTGTEQKT
jgi:hypothetical protein